ncbi:MAG: ATP-binding cassette domain-containing protein [Cytophagales bacterium]|nr:ATP-binding cassette domain-containing protein [Armatimonadota bacterium]
MSSNILSPVSPVSSVPPVPSDNGVARSKVQRKSDTAIEVSNIAKCYTILHEERQTSFTQAALSKARNPFQRPEKEVFWALNGVSFEVNRGEVVGIIGRNGAGKSTLLKVLSRITEPTRGTAKLHGRVGSLLEVGTGFHPELTGRENVFLNGAVLGMNRQEIERQFDAIVDFSGTEKFLDTPVKRYSSGMYVRLAFAVAAHLNPEILIVDEVLAVGDGDFQRKCLGKMKDVASQGRTILFVSHAMASIQQLCSRCVYLEKGKVRADGPTAYVIEEYISSGAEGVAEAAWDDLQTAPGNEVVRLIGTRVVDCKGKVSAEHKLSDPITLEMEFVVTRPGILFSPVFHIYNSYHVCVFHTTNWTDPVWGEREYEPGTYRAQVTVPGEWLNEGGYSATPIITRDTNNVLIKLDECLSFNVNDDGAGRGSFAGPIIGVLRPALPWTVTPVRE